MLKTDPIHSVHSSVWESLTLLAFKGDVENWEIGFLFQQRLMAKIRALLSPQWSLALACGCLWLSEEKQKHLETMGTASG